MKCILYILVLINFTRSVDAQKSDSSEIRLSKSLQNVGWLKHYEEYKKRNNEVIKGAIKVDKRLRFYSNKKFEMRVFYDNSPLFADYRDVTIGSCVRNDGIEVSILSGTWLVKKDTVYLNYQLELIYENDTYFSNTDSRRWDPDIKRIKTHINACKLMRFEKYTFKGNQLLNTDKDYPNFE